MAIEEGQAHYKGIENTCNKIIENFSKSKERDLFASIRVLHNAEHTGPETPQGSYFKVLLLTILFLL